MKVEGEAGGERREGLWRLWFADSVAGDVLGVVPRYKEAGKLTQWNICVWWQSTNNQPGTTLSYDSASYINYMYFLSNLVEVIGGLREILKLL